MSFNSQNTNVLGLSGEPLFDAGEPLKDNPNKLVSPVKDSKPKKSSRFIFPIALLVLLYMIGGK